MKILSVLLFFLPATALASHVSRECSSSNGYLRYSYSYDFLNPEIETWLMGGEIVENVTQEELGVKVELFREETPMYIVMKYAVEMKVATEERGYKDFMLCTVSSGF